MIIKTHLPKIGAPATRALASIGVTNLESLAEFSESEILALHGMGPKAMDILREKFKENGLSFAADGIKNTK